MNLLSDVINYIRRLIKAASNGSVNDNLIIDYINRFVLMDMDARVQLFDYKTKYQFQTRPGINHYNMPLYNTNGYPTQTEPGNQMISYYPVYQGFMNPVYVNGMQIPLFTENSTFFSAWPIYTQPLNDSYFGDGTAGPYTLSLPYAPAVPGYVDITGIIAAGSSIDPIVAASPNTNIVKTSIYPGVFITTQDAENNNVVVSDSGQFLQASGVTGNMQLGMLIGDCTSSYSVTSNVVNYTTGEVVVTFDTPIPDDVSINLQCYYIQPGRPTSVLFQNNCLTLMAPPDKQYLVELTAYLTPAAFLSTSNSIPFAYMCEYIARGSARKMLSDTGDWEQFMAYEPLFKEQELLVWKRSARIKTENRTPTIYSDGIGFGNSYYGGGVS